MSCPHSINSQEVAMPTGIKGLSSCGIGHWVNARDEFNIDHMPRVNKAQALTRHLQPHWLCCCSSFHHFHSPMSPLFLCNHAGVGHSIKEVAFGCFLPFEVSELKNNDEIWEAFIATPKLSDFSNMSQRQTYSFSQQSTSRTDKCLKLDIEVTGKEL